MLPFKRLQELDFQDEGRVVPLEADAVGRSHQFPFQETFGFAVSHAGIITFITTLPPCVTTFRPAGATAIPTLHCDRGRRV